MLATGACALDLDDDERALLATMQLTAPPPSPTNRFADDDDAAGLGRSLFFDPSLSADGEISCASCHDPAAGFSDPRPVSLGVYGRAGRRHSMPITAVAFQRFLFWDGRADSLWAQPLQALESDVEMDFTRLELAHAIEARHRDAYQSVFGALPDLADLPARGRPGMEAWDRLPAERQDAVNRVLANVGKALEAYQRRLLCADTRFDQWTRGELELSASEETGAARFVRFGCIACHGGPAFSDGEHHNIGIGSGQSEPDLGRADALDRLRADLFNGAGPYSDDPDAGRAILTGLDAELGTLGAFRTPSLRGVGQRTALSHRGIERDAGRFVDDVYDAPHMENSAVGEMDPAMEELEVSRTGDLAAFLRTLDCPRPPPEWLAP